MPGKRIAILTHILLSLMGYAKSETLNNVAFTITVLNEKSQPADGYRSQTSEVYHIPGVANSTTISIQPATDSLKAVNVIGKRPLIEQKEGKVILNLDDIT